MYEKFYGLSVDPFRLSPDHRFSFSHPSYAKAKAYIQYALHRAEGFVMVTGKPGTGKTTLVNDVLEGLSRTDVVVATLVSTQLEADDLLRMVAYSFGLGADATHKALVLQRVMDFLFRQHREGRRALLIIDEAQDLSSSGIEELRLLTNLQRVGQPLLQIVLVGQESLRDLVRRPDLEQVRQRLVASCDLEPLGRIDTLAYVGHRLGRAGWRDDPTIGRDVWPIVYDFSRGLPRRINLICSRLLLHGYVEERHTLTARDAAFVVTELQQEELAPTESGMDAEHLPVGGSVGKQSSEQERYTPESELVQEEGSGRAREYPRDMSTDRLGHYADEGITSRPDGSPEVGDIICEPGFAQDTEPVVADNPLRLSPPIQGDPPNWVSPPHGQPASEYPRTEEPGPHGRTLSQGGLPGDSGSRLGASQDRGAEALSWHDGGSGKEPTQEPRESRGSRGSPREDATRTANANIPATPGERESGGRAAGRAHDNRPRGYGAWRIWRGIVSLTLGLVVLVGAGFYFRPDVLEPELAWLEREMSSIAQTARALFGRLTGADGKQGHEKAHGQLGRGVGEVGRTGSQRDEHVAADGATAIRPASKSGGATGAVEEERAGSAGPTSPKSSLATEGESGGRRVGSAVPTDASRATEE